MADFSRGSRISLWASKQGYGNGSFEGVEAPTQEPVTIKLTPTHRHRVLYTVRNEKGEPIPGATLSFYTQEMKRMRMSSPAFGGNDALADEEGHCEYGFAEPGIVTIWARATGYLPREIDIEIPEEGDLENLEITLPGTDRAARRPSHRDRTADQPVERPGRQRRGLLTGRLGWRDLEDGLVRWWPLRGSPHPDERRWRLHLAERRRGALYRRG